MEKTTSRRAVLLRFLQVPLGGGLLLGLSACGSEGSNSRVCADESAMTAAEKSLRRTLNYSETSPDPAKTCSACEFFEAAAGGGGCGTCEMFGGKQANAGGYCVSWSVDPETAG